MEGESKYVCWGKDQEDLTEKVKKTAADSAKDTVFEFVRADAPFGGDKGHELREKRIVVFCSHGHKNVFDLTD